MALSKYFHILFLIAILQHCADSEISNQEFERINKAGRSVRGVIGSASNLNHLRDLNQSIHLITSQTGDISQILFDPAAIKMSNDYKWLVGNTPIQSIGDHSKSVLTQIQKLLGLEKPEHQFTLNSIFEFKSSKLATVFFSQSYAGYPVRDAFIQVNYATTKVTNKVESSEITELYYNLRDALNRSYDVTGISKDSFANASNISLQDIVPLKISEIKQSSQIIYPLTVSGKTSYVPAVEFYYTAQGTMHTTTISVTDNSILESYHHKHSIQEHTLKAKVYSKNYLSNDTLDVPLSFATINTGGEQFIANANGIVQLPDGTQNISVSLAGARGNILDVADQEQVVSFELNIAGDETILDSENLNLPALNTYAGLQIINSYIRRSMTADMANFLEESLNIYVNDATDACNAFYQANSKIIVLHEAGSVGNITCPNMAVINDVFHHEYGHALDDYTGLRQQGPGGILYGILDGAFSEGIGDILATYFNATPNLGSGFFQGTATPLRQMNNQKVYPDSILNDVHADGEIIGRAFWELREGLIAEHGTTRGPNIAADLFFCHLTLTNTFTDSYPNVLLCDDEDSNAMTPSENYCTINKAFSAAGLAEAEGDCVPEGVPNKVLLTGGLELQTGYDEEGNMVFLAHAGLETSRVFCCLGKAPSLSPGANLCSESEAAIKFRSLGELESQRVFQSEPILTLANLDLFTCNAKNFEGEVYLAAQIKASEK